MAGSMFNIGMEVEVSLKEGKPGDVWYRADVIGKTGDSSYVVKFYGTGLTVNVDALHIRPRLPILECREFTLFGKADVFFGYGWARGVITSSVKDDRCTVLLDHANEEKEVCLGDMRPCTYWIDGRWVIASKEHATKSLVISSEDHLTGSEKDGNLPFKKCSPFWTTLEGRDVFQKMPQKPHFKPLLSTNESNREDLAIAHMVTFANIAESTSMFQIDDDLKNTIEGHLESLSDLEAHGFKVDPIRDRLNQFLLKKEEKEKIASRLQEVRLELEERTLESREIDEEIQELDKKIEELQAKRNSAISAAAKIDTDIATMETEFDVTIQEAQNARHDFENLVAGPLFP